MAEKRAIGIEQLLRWAYRDELPKAQADSVGLHVGPLQFGQAWGGVERYGELLTLIDESRNAWGLVPDLTAWDAQPDPDAVIVGEAVAALAGRGFGLPDGWDPLGDMGALGPLGEDAVARALNRLTARDEAGQVTLRDAPGFFVIRHALIGGCPVWEGEAPELKVECGARGRPRWFRRISLVGRDGTESVIEVDGYDAKQRGPAPDAYRKFYLDPDPAEVVLARGEYEVWHAALGVLVEELDGKLDRFAVTSTSRPARPWDPGSVEPPRTRVLPDLGRTFAMPQRVAHKSASRAKRKISSATHQGA